MHTFGLANLNRYKTGKIAVKRVKEVPIKISPIPACDLLWATPERNKDRGGGVEDIYFPRLLKKQQVEFP